MNSKQKNPSTPKTSGIKRTSFGERLFRITRSKKITLKTLGEKIGISKRMVTYYETNDMGPPLHILKQMADVLNVTVAYLVDESPLKIVEIDETSTTIKKDITDFKNLPRKDQRTISNTIAGLKAKNQLQNKE